MIDANDTLFVIRDESNKLIVGVCSLTVFKKKAIAQWMAVRSEYRGRGLGRFLINSVNEINRDKLIELNFEPRLTRFYEELGYITTKEPESQLIKGIRRPIRHEY